MAQDRRVRGPEILDVGVDIVRQDSLVRFLETFRALGIDIQSSPHMLFHNLAQDVLLDEVLAADPERRGSSGNLRGGIHAHDPTNYQEKGESNDAHGYSYLLTV